MKISNLILALAAVAVMASSCGSPLNTTSTTTAPAVSAAYTNGQAAGSALKMLYAQYKVDGKVNLSNVSNLLAMASLASSVQSLKGQAAESSFYKEFATGLVVGSSNLVTTTTTNPVMTGLSTMASMDMSSILTLAAAAAAQQQAQPTQPAQQQAPVQQQPAQSQVSSGVNTTVNVLNSTADIVNSVGGILSLFGK